MLLEYLFDGFLPRAMHMFYEFDINCVRSKRLGNTAAWTTRSCATWSMYQRLQHVYVLVCERSGHRTVCLWSNSSVSERSEGFSFGTAR